ncbi:aminomethyl transferase family protein [Stakelama sp. CBK3Z-3]|uniref:Aminomethyl transferase family protein n=1 Tax=Stakelama flava TaxID=2860338 RepID=A0ABS6XPJ1_9SPHN|nr:aminomethyl transferase family protein [Stakelama flava]MBW4332132.1 aminomethyl transferase family protein [Stakelama flava]
MTAPSLQDGIDKAGSPMKLLWKPNPPTQTVPKVEPEFSGWEKEQHAYRDAVILYDLCHHMNDLFIEGPDAMKLLTAVSANDYEKFVIGQAKQFVPVTRNGDIVTDGILMRMADNKFLLSGVPASQNWVRYYGQRDGYDVGFVANADSHNRRDGPPALFRYQLQGPKAMAMMERLLGTTPPDVKFFHSEEVTIGGRKLRAFRHGMAGQPGFELLGDWEDNDAVKQAILDVGEGFGLVQVGGLAYYTNGIESGWIPTPTPGIYTDPELEDYRKFVPLFSYEGQKPLHGSFYSDNIEDYYVSPYELGYGRSIKFNHDFIGRESLEKAKDSYRRTRVTFVFNPDDVKKVLGDPGYLLRYPRDRVEVNGEMVGLSMYTANFPDDGTLLSLGLIDKAHAAPGTEVEIVFGEHPGPEAPADFHRSLPRIRAKVQPSPYDQVARTSYRG